MSTAPLLEALALLRSPGGSLRSIYAGAFSCLEARGCPFSERDSLTTSSSSRLFFPTRRLCYRRGALFLLPLASSGPTQGQGLQPTAPGYSGVSRPRRALLVRRSGETHLYPPHATSPPGSPLLLGQSLSATRKAVGGCPLPPPFLSLPLIGSRWRNVTPGALR